MSADAIIVFGAKCDCYHIIPDYVPDYFCTRQVYPYELEENYAPKGTKWVAYTGLHFFDSDWCGGYRKEFLDVLVFLKDLLEDEDITCIYYGYDCLDQTKVFTWKDWCDMMQAYINAARKEYNQ